MRWVVGGGAGAVRADPLSSLATIMSGPSTPGLDLERLALHVVDLGNNGLLSAGGTLASSPEQLERVFEHLDLVHAHWDVQDPLGSRHVVLYAHGGLNDEDHALSVAQQNLNWWLNNRVYPVFFVWQSGPFETFMDRLADALVPPAAREPASLAAQERFGFDLIEVIDQGVEDVARAGLRWMWEEMKKNARAASAPIPDTQAIAWPPDTDTARSAMTAMPGATLTAIRLRGYLDAHPRAAVHLAGHSAGAIFHTALLARLADLRIPVRSLQFLAPALRVDDFTRDVLPALQTNGVVRDFTTFALSDQLERADVCAAGGIDIYHHSLLYLVSRALEDSGPSGSPPDGEVPLLGMEKFFDLPGADGSTLREAIANCGDTSAFSPSLALPDSRSQATSHGGFSGDPLTMTSVVMRILGLTQPQPENAYQADAPLRDTST